MTRTGKVSIQLVNAENLVCQTPSRRKGRERPSGADTICNSVQTVLHFFSKDHEIATFSRWVSEKLSKLSLSHSQYAAPNSKVCLSYCTFGL